MDDNGDLTPECFLSLREALNTHVFKQFQPVKDKLMEKRQEYFDTKNWAEYSKIIGKGS